MCVPLGELGPRENDLRRLGDDGDDDDSSPRSLDPPLAVVSATARDLEGVKGVGGLRGYGVGFWRKGEVEWDRIGWDGMEYEQWGVYSLLYPSPMRTYLNPPLRTYLCTNQPTNLPTYSPTVPVWQLLFRFLCRC